MTPSVRALLTALEEAGPAGLTTGDLARLFDEPDSMQRRLARIGTELRRYRGTGFVTRSGREEPSAYYQNAPVYRWFIAPSGLAYLDGGMRDGQDARARAAREAADREKAARKARQGQLLREAAAGYEPVMCMCSRDAEIRHLNAEGCLRDAIGAVYGITRERARQIAAGVNTPPSCWKPGHDYCSTPCAHGIVTPASPERARRRARRTA